MKYNKIKRHNVEKTTLCASYYAASVFIIFCKAFEIVGQLLETD